MSPPSQGGLATRSPQTAPVVSTDAATRVRRTPRHRGAEAGTGQRAALDAEGARANFTRAGPIPAARGSRTETGEALAAGVRERFVPIVGRAAADAARVHTGPGAQARARRERARAVTDGVDIFFGAGEFTPGTRSGDALIAHELAHVGQALRGELDVPARWATVDAERTATETSADDAARRAADAAGLSPDEAAGSEQADGESADGSPDTITASIAAGFAALIDLVTTPQPTSDPAAGGQTGEAGSNAEPAAATGADTGAETAVATALPPGLPLMPDPPTTLSTAEQQRITGVRRRAGTSAKATAAAPTPLENVTDAQSAVAVPQAESNARATEAVVAALGEAVKPSVEIVALCDRIKKLIREKRPADEDGVIDSRPEEVAAAAGAAVQGDVNADVTAAKGSYGPLAATPAGPQPPQPPGVEPIPVAAPSPDVDARAGTPDAIPPEQVALDGDAQQMAAKADAAGFNAEAAQLVEGGPVGEAREARGELGDLAKDGPAEVLKQQQAALATSDANLAALQLKAVQSLRDARAGHIVGVGDQQDTLTGGAEDLRTRLAGKAQGIFTSAQSRVQDLLRDVPTIAMGKWTTGMPPISRQFKADLKIVADQVEERHSGVSGFFVAGWDAVTGLPGWVKRAYDAAEKNFGDSVTTLITGISIYVNGIIRIADEIIKDARAQISAVFAKELPAEDAEWAAQQEKAFGAKLDALQAKAEQTRTSFTKELIDNAGNAVQAAREEVQTLRKKAGGLWGRFLDAVGRFLDDPLRFIINGLLELVGISPPAFWAVIMKIGQVIGDIVDAPIRFANNLMAGVAKGFSQFFDHIGQHLLAGLLEWLLSGLKDEGISVEVPKEISVKSVVGFFLQLLGISWTRIRKLLVEQLGEKAVAVIEKTAGVISTLVTKGVGGILDDIKHLLDPQNIVDTIVDVAVKYIAETLIVKVAVKVIAMLNPAGAILAAIEAIYRVLKWVFTNAAKIFHLIEAVVNGLADVISGNIGGVAKTVEKALATLIAPVIDFLADYLGLGGLPGKVAQAVKGLQAWVEGVMRSVIRWLVELGRKMMRALGLGGKDDEKPGQAKAGDGEVGAHIGFSGGGESHTLYFDEHGDNATLMVASTPMTIWQRLDDFDRRLAGEGSLPYFSDDRERDQAKALIIKARGMTTEADQDADALVRAHRAVEKAKSATTEDNLAPAAESAEAAADARVTQQEESIGSVLSQLYGLFEEHPGDAELTMRSAYSGATGSGEVSFTRSRRSATKANVMVSGPVAGNVAGANRGRVKFEAAALGRALAAQKSLSEVQKKDQEELAPRIEAFEEAGRQGEEIADARLKGMKPPPSLDDLQSKLGDTATEAAAVAEFKLVGGGELIERAVTKLHDKKRDRKDGVFALVEAMTVEIDRLVAEARGDEGASTTRRLTPSRTLADSSDVSRPAATVGAKGPLVSALGTYEEIVTAIRRVVPEFGQKLVRAIHGIPVAPIRATARLVLKGAVKEKDQDRFLQEVTFLMYIEMVRAKTAWAFAIPALIEARTSREVAAALSDTHFPHAQAGFLKLYRTWGPAAFDEASERLFARLGVDFEQRSGFRRGGEVFLKVDQIDTAVDAILAKLEKIYDDQVAQL